MEPTIISVIAVVWILSAVATILLVSNRGDDLVIWVALSVAFGPIALVMAHFRSGDTCPYCFGRIHRNAQRCPHCRQDISLKDEIVISPRGSSENFSGSYSGPFEASNRPFGTHFFLIALYGLMILLGAGWVMVLLLTDL